ncbi:MAG: NAD(+) kinase [Clostridia bacterium]|nr:NAD(+) kinase [Clostridia bacterium]
MKKIGLIINYFKQQPIKLGMELINWLEKNHIEVLCPIEEARELNLKNGVSQEEFCKNVDIVIVLGGDGTLLRAARFVAGFQTPLLGVNLGYLGFLTEIEEVEIYPFIEKILAGEYKVEERMMLKATIQRDNRNIATFCALNDFVINKGSFARLITLETYLADELINSYSSDGVIVSTPTGSTAYSLSAGGPIVDPSLDVCIITPICPHTLDSRPLVIPPEKIIKVIIKAVRTDAMLTVDGQHGYQLKNNDIILISKAEYVTTLIKVKGRSFFDILREKLRISGGSSYE